MTRELSPSARKIQDALASLDAQFEVVELPASARTAIEAAAAIGCSVGQIAKSIVFRTVQSRTPVLVVASGANRVNEALIAEYVGEAIEKADAAYVREKTGFAIGGVAPLGHAEPILTIIDEDLFAFDELWAAAGTPNAVFKLTASSLAQVTGGTVKGIK
jgi:prolyl-tRNA editing enzyme YbaK/EbsC (Cys-tRNA(Pro) deacylase)